MCSIYISHFNPSPSDKYHSAHTAGLRLLSFALADCYNIHLSENELTNHIETGTYGKPFLKSHGHIPLQAARILPSSDQHIPLSCARQDIHFNISHCSAMAVCAISTEPVGVDIERIRPFNERIIQKALTADEQKFLNQMSIDASTRQEWFFRFWTLKESRIKHSGKGLSMPLTDFSFSFDISAAPYKVYCSENHLYFTQKLIDSQYILSVCTSLPQTQFRMVYI